MRDPKTLTELAAMKRRRAHEERTAAERYGTGLADLLAAPLERDAAALLTLPGPPDVGPGGEVVNAHAAPDGVAVKLPARSEGVRCAVRETLTKGASRIAEDASLRRADLLMRPSFDALALGLDAAESVGATNSIEKMLSHQMAVLHETSMRLMDRALRYKAGAGFENEGDPIAACRLANTAARLMSVFQDAALTLHRLRTGGNQTVTVQHVNVQSGAQAVIGNVRAGGVRGRNGGGAKAKNG